MPRPPNTWMLWLLTVVAGALIMVPTIMTGRLIEERSDNIGELRRREIELERLSRRLGLALDSSQIGVWELNTETNEPALGRPHERALRLPGRWRSARICRLGAHHPSRGSGARAEGLPHRRGGRRQLPDAVPAAARRRGPPLARERQGLPGSRRAAAHRRRQLGRHRRRRAEREPQAGQHADRGPQPSSSKQPRSASSTIRCTIR